MDSLDYLLEALEVPLTNPSSSSKIGHLKMVRKQSRFGSVPYHIMVDKLAFIAYLAYRN